MKRILISTALLAGVCTYAGGFRVSLQGVKQLAMAHTSAHAEDASIAFFNPAGISFIPSKFIAFIVVLIIYYKCLFQLLYLYIYTKYCSEIKVVTTFIFLSNSKNCRNICLVLYLKVYYKYLIH